MKYKIKSFLFAIPFLITLCAGNANAMYKDEYKRFEREQARLYKEKGLLIDERAILTDPNSRNRGDQRFDEEQRLLNIQAQEKAIDHQEKGLLQEWNVLRQKEENNRAYNQESPFFYRQQHVEGILNPESERLELEARRLQRARARHQQFDLDQDEDLQKRWQEQENGRKTQDQQRLKQLERDQQRRETLKNNPFLAAISWLFNK